MPRRCRPRPRRRGESSEGSAEQGRKGRVKYSCAVRESACATAFPPSPLSHPLRDLGDGEFLPSGDGRASPFEPSRSFLFAFPAAWTCALPRGSVSEFRCPCLFRDSPAALRLTRHATLRLSCRRDQQSVGGRQGRREGSGRGWPTSLKRRHESCGTSERGQGDSKGGSQGAARGASGLAGAEGVDRSAG